MPKLAYFRSWAEKQCQLHASVYSFTLNDGSREIQKSFVPFCFSFVQVSNINTQC